jgi:hypothetical protein
MPRIGQGFSRNEASRPRTNDRDVAHSEASSARLRSR